MKRIRTKIKTVDAIFCSDIHLRETLPPCRTDDFMSVQWRKMKWLQELQQKYNCPVYHAGDLFDHWKPSPFLLSLAMLHLPAQFHTIYGNHDLKEHNYDLIEKTGIHTLETAGKLTVCSGTPWGYVPDENNDFIEIKGRKVLLWHVMTYKGAKPYPGCTDTAAAGLLRKYRSYDIIVTGHNHQSFVDDYNGRLIVNPGCLTRQESDNAEFVPKVYLYHALDNTLTPVTVPHEKGVVVQPIKTQAIEERNERIDAFITKLNTDWDITVDFEKNLQRFLSVNPVDTEIEKIIMKAINE